MVFPETLPTLPPLSIYARLVPPDGRRLFWAYCFYLSLLARRGLSQPSRRHPKSFSLLYCAVSRPWPAQTLLGFLQQEFIARNLSLSLLLEPLDGFEWLSNKRYDLDFFDASPVLMQIVAPFSRLIAVLNGQTPPFYQPFADLVFGYLALYLSCNQPAAAALSAARVSLSPAVVKQKLQPLAHEACHAMSAASSFGFRLKVGFFLGLFAILGKRYCRGVLSPRLDFSVYVKAFFKGLWYTLRIKNRTRMANRI